MKLRKTLNYMIANFKKPAYNLTAQSYSFVASDKFCYNGQLNICFSTLAFERKSLKLLHGPITSQCIDLN